MSSVTSLLEVRTLSYQLVTLLTYQLCRSFFHTNSICWLIIRVEFSNPGVGTNYFTLALLYFKNYFGL